MTPASEEWAWAARRLGRLRGLDLWTWALPVLWLGAFVALQVAARRGGSLGAPTWGEAEQTLHLGVMLVVLLAIGTVLRALHGERRALRLALAARPGATPTEAPADLGDGAEAGPGDRREGTGSGPSES